MSPRALLIATIASGVVVYAMAGLVVAYRYEQPGTLARVAMGVLWPAVSLAVVGMWLLGIDEPPLR